MLNVSPPRVCGDYNSIKMNNDTTPRMRGLPAIQSIKHVRYNPAYAGTTLVLLCQLLNAAIQPRVCGDYPSGSARRSVLQDTTPRMRGLQVDTESVWVDFRYNPAYAGTTDRLQHVLTFVSIQPRVCGDYRSRGEQAYTADDTTPRMRGLREPIMKESQISRYNPAYAGTTDSIATCPAADGIQPRVCGDYQFAKIRSPRHLDTTPRMRGLLIILGLS